MFIDGPNLLHPAPCPAGATAIQRLDRIPGKRVQQIGNDAGEGVTPALWVVRDGERQGDGQLRFSPVEAEQLHAELCYVLGDSWNTAGEAPVCRERGAPRGCGWP